jgi:acyl transferase domain-containing protein
MSRRSRSVIRLGLDECGVAPEQIGYIEAHGTGTPLGDPIEIEALAETVGLPRASDDVCAIGS